MKVYINKNRNYICFDEFKHIPDMQDTLVYVATLNEKEGLHIFDDFKPWEGPEQVIMYQLPDGGYTEDIFDDRLLGEPGEEILFVREWKEGVVVKCTKFEDLHGVCILDNIITFNEPLY